MNGHETTTETERPPAYLWHIRELLSFSFICLLMAVWIELLLLHVGSGLVLFVFGVLANVWVWPRIYKQAHHKWLLFMLKRELRKHER